MIIYKITNLINGKIYIGKTKKDLKWRIRKHIRENKYYVARALNKYGLESFEISVIDNADTRKVVNEKERYWIKFYDCRSPKGYNCTKGGDGNDNPRSEETREKIRVANLGERHPQYGKHQSEESNQKRREALMGEKNHNYGKDLSGSNNPSYGKRRSIETRLKMSKPRSIEGCANIRTGTIRKDVMERRIRTRKENAMKVENSKTA